jgi:hypothetical protein
MAEYAVEIRTALIERSDEEEAKRLGFRFIETYDNAPAELRRHLVEPEPESTGDPRFDAFVAAIVEYVCARDFELAPAWVDHTSRFLTRWWFVSGVRALHANALVHSPISFARRGVFVSEGSLSYA